MDESNKELKELESVHEKHKKTQEVCLRMSYALMLMTDVPKIFFFLFRCND